MERQALLVAAALVAAVLAVPSVVATDHHYCAQQYPESELCEGDVVGYVCGVVWQHTGDDPCWWTLPAS